MNLSFAPKILRPAAAAACLLGFALFHGTLASSSAAPALVALDDKLPDLPFTSDFSKGDGDNGPNVLTLKNTGNADIRASGTVALAVASHGDRKTKDIPEKVVGRDESWTITSLASGDKVTITADGYAPLVLMVP
jgi:hypothetical protein